MGRKVNTVEQLLVRIEKKSNGCWEWAGHRNPKGYGVATIAGKTIPAHRFFYAHYKGEIPNGLFVCHTCDNPPCVNPAHLWLGTIMDNTKDKIKKGRQAKGEVHPASRLKECEVRRIFELEGEKTHKQIAQMFGVDETNVFQILRGKTWTHLGIVPKRISLKAPSKTLSLVALVLDSAALAKALGITRPKLSQLLGGYNLAHPQTPIKPDSLTTGKRGKPGNLYDADRVHVIASALGLSLEVREVK